MSLDRHRTRLEPRTLSLPTGAPARLFTIDDPRGPHHLLEAWERRLRLADHECDHGRLPGDSSPACGCWVGEPRQELAADLIDSIPNRNGRTTMHPFDDLTSVAMDRARLQLDEPALIEHDPPVLLELDDPSPDPNAIGELAESHDPTEGLDYGRDFIPPNRELLARLGITNRPADEDRAGGLNTLTRFADADACTPKIVT